MSVVRVLPLAKRCSNCRFRTLNVFASLAGLSVRPAPPREHAPSKFTFMRNERAFSTTKKNSDNAISNCNPELEDTATAKPQEDADLSDKPTPDGQSALPWYLQNQGEEAARPVMKGQELPELPSDAPEKLRLILERLSIDIGLDNLSLIDLRKIDPPPALGSNMIMIIGTARSEKHLHVSADRFCGWLRTEHKLRPYADGLLGTNELKLKLRRKARRAKLLGGTSKPSEEDDGIRSEWICVNVGPVEKSRGTEQSLEKEGIIGFGGREDGTRLVVQMLTETKRADIDLETLWNGFIRRQGRKEERAAAEIAELTARSAENEVGLDESLSASVADQSPNTRSSQNMRSSLSKTQIRTFHSYSACRNQASPSTGSRDPSTLRNLMVSDFEIMSDDLSPAEYDSDRAAFATHITRLEDRGNPEILAALGKNCYDRDSTTYLEKFYDMIPAFPKAYHWIGRFRLIQIGIDAGHQGYTIDSLIGLLHEAQAASVALEPMTYKSLIRLIATTLQENRDQSHTGDGMEYLLAILSILEDMEIRRMRIDQHEILHDVFAVYEHARASEIYVADPRLRADSASRFARLLNRNGAKIPSLSLPIMVLDELSSAERWESYWRYWRHLPINIFRRPQILYTAMFFQLARNQHQKMCFDALTTWIPMLELERPAIEITADLATAIMECLKIADPDVVQQVRSNENEDGQWVRLWHICERGFDKDAEDTDALQDEAAEMYKGVGKTYGSYQPIL